ncbi:MAG TPA: PQQ-dependent sugar dehydrogenase, partial [Acidimicrobiales bacterium]
MTTPRPVAATLALVALAPVALSGCGGDGDDGAEATAAAAPLAELDLALTSIGTFEQPISIVSRPDDTALFVAGFRGTVTRVDVAGEGADRTYTKGDVLLDIDDQVITEGERGLLDIEFSPDGDRLYVSYSAEPDGAHTVVSYAYNGATLDPGSRKEVFSLPDTEPNHNGGDLEFGPDGYLYYALGDGGGGGDPQGNAQNTDSLLGKILRLDPEGATGDEGYVVPADNPFAGGAGGGRPEVWAYGLRNPWRFSFDSRTGDLWIGDVGQGAWEEVDLLPAGEGGTGAGKGANLGWNEMEGSHGYEGGSNPEGAVLPVYEYALHEDGTCAVTGGIVYRGPYEDLQGAYVYGDSCQSKVRALRVEGGEVTEHVVFDDAGVEQLVSFGTDNGGDLYVVGMAAGEIFRIDDPTPGDGGGGDPTPSSSTDPPAPSSSSTEPPSPSSSTAPPTPSSSAPPAAPAAADEPGGLLAEYFPGVELAGTPGQTRIEPRVLLDYEHEPFEGFPADGWSVRWSGDLRVDTAGEYTLIVTSDEGARLWVDGQVVIDAWSAHSVRDDAVEITLAAGRHPIRLEYYDQAGVAFAKLSWAGPGISREVIPGPNLHPATA